MVATGGGGPLPFKRSAAYSLFAVASAAETDEKTTDTV